MNSIIEQKTGLYVEKRSRFISYVFRCDSKDEEENLLKNIRKEHASARHVCYASVINGDSIYSDDKEPSGTAGAQLSLLISKYDLMNVLLVVVRYFGGVKLGTSGLTNAYKTSAQMCIEGNTKQVVLKEKFSVKCDYTSFDQIKKTLTLNSIEISNQIFGDDVGFEVYLSQEEKALMPKNCLLTPLGDKKYM